MAYLNIPEIYWDNETLNNDERVILSIVHSYQGSCYWSVSKWCEKFRQSKPTILRLIHSLEERGYLEAIRVNGKSTTYRILDHTGKQSLPVKKLDRTGKESLLVPVKNFDRTGKESLPYIYKYKNSDKERDKESASATATAHTDTATADPVTPSPQTIVESEQATEQERIKLEETSPLKKLKKERKKIGSLEELNLTPEVRAAADRWMEHKRTIGKPIKLSKLIAEVRKHGGAFPAVVERSIDQGWTGLFPLPKIAPWLRASMVASDWISAVGKFDPAKPGTGKASEEVIKANHGLKEIILKIRDKEQIRKSSDFVTRIKQDEFFRNRIEKSIKEELTVVLTSGIGGK